MKSNKYKIQVFTLLLVLLAFVGCDDEGFLEETPKTFYTTNNIFSSETQIDQVLITMYSDLRYFKIFNEQMRSFGTDVLDAPLFRLSTSFTDYSKLTAETGNFETVFNFFYKMIANANTAIEAANLDDISFESEESKAYILAQARFFRAYAHGNLAELFGGVAIVTEMATEASFDYVRATREETYQYAIDELEAIVDDMPETSSQGGRLVKGAVQHYLSEFYLALGTETSSSTAFDQAIYWASEVIDGGTYSLMTERFGVRKNDINSVTGGADVWWDLFRNGNINYTDGNMESIWTFQVDYDAYLTEDDDAYMPYPRYFAPVYRALAGFTGVLEDAGGRGVAFYAPTPLTEDVIWDESIAAGDMRNSEHNISRKIIYNDPSYPDLLGQQVPQSVIDVENASSGKIFPIYYKLNTDQYEGLDDGEDRSNIFRDKYAIRLPETILIRAEAYYRKGETQNAADDINLIRSRAECDVLASASDVDIDYILDERARELYIEESRWNTLLRMGGTVATDRIKEYALHEHVALTLTFDYNLWPIPQDVIDSNKDVVWEQNSGWDR
jgi:hypothetical protein